MNHVIICSFITMVVAQLLKVPFAYIKHKQWDLKLLFSTGALPSSHSAVVVATTIIVGFISGVNSPAFGISFVFGLIVIHDAIKVRGEGNKQARAINLLVRKVEDMALIDKINVEELDKIKLNELIGHTVPEVIIGMIVGAIIGFGYGLIIL